jgi:hypothetical protein
MVNLQRGLTGTEITTMMYKQSTRRDQARETQRQREEELEDCGQKTREGRGREWDGMDDSHERETLGRENCVGGNGIGVDSFSSPRETPGGKKSTSWRSRARSKYTSDFLATTYKPNWPRQY